MLSGSASLKDSLRTSFTLAAIGLTGGVALLADVASSLSHADKAVIGGLAAGITFCAARAAFSRAHFGSFTAAYDHYADRGYDARVAALVMAALYAGPYFLR